MNHIARLINKGSREYKYNRLPWVDVCLHGHLYSSCEDDIYIYIDIYIDIKTVLINKKYTSSVVLN